MKKLFLCIVILGSSMAVLAQKDRSKNVKSNYLYLPSYDVSSVDPATITAEFAMKEGSFSTEQLKDKKTHCVPKGGSLKDAVEVTTYYYQMKKQTGDAFVVARDGSGQLLFASKTAEGASSEVKFGYDKCQYWVLDALKKDWKAQSASFKSTQANKSETAAYNQAQQEAANNLFLTYMPQEFAVYSAKGKEFDYAELDAAFEKAMTAYAGILKRGVNDEDNKLLREAIAVWEKELESLNAEDKKSRINKSIGKGLHENCARAYMYLYEFDKAIKHGRMFKKLFGNFSNNRSTAFDGLMSFMEAQKIAAERNTAALSDVAKLNSLAASSKGKTANVKRLPSSEAERLSSEYMDFRMKKYSEVAEDRKEEEDAAIASGELNPYQKYVQVTSMGSVLMLTMVPNDLLGIPELTELPKEMCALTELSQIVIMNNKIESVSSDIGKLENLNKLDLSKNQLKSLPPEIGNLKNLKTLKLSNNPISSLPAEIANCTNLKSLVLKGTAINADEQKKIAEWLPNCKIKY